MRLASYNLENLFLRARALNGDTWAEGREVLKAQADLNRILGKSVYTAADKTKVTTLLKQLGLEKSDESKFAILRQNRGHLVKRPKSKPIEIVANGRDDWIGWVELTRVEVNETATRNTARVIAELNADVLGVIEAESRPALLRFSAGVLPAVNATPYEHLMLIDGNDDRGIDVGILTKKDFEIVSICSHVDDRDNQGLIFSRDCAQYEIKTKNGNTLVVLVNHLKSKGYGVASESDAKRKRQAARVADIYKAVVANHPHVAVIGDMNDTPDSDPLKPLVEGTGLKEISTLSGFDNQGRPGTYKNGTASNKIDFILLSPALFAKATAGGINRKGVWGGTNGTLFPHYPEITKENEAASDHAAIWADLNI
jgi:endonuclease/exonuclease/phosphatase family metal-dependent hydrolase